MEDAAEKPRIDLNNLDAVGDIEAMRGALRLALEGNRARAESGKEIASLRRELELRSRELEEAWQNARETSERLSKTRQTAAEAEEKAAAAETEKKILASRLKDLERKTAEIEGARKGFASLMAQISEARERATEAENARKELMTILSQIPEGMGAQEALLRMQDAKNKAENRARLAELERDSCVSMLKDWECKAANLENLLKKIEERENDLRLREKSLTGKEGAVEERARLLENEYAAKRKELDALKEQMRAEIEELTRRYRREEKRP